MKNFKIERTTTIYELIDNVEMSIRLKNNLIKASKQYRFLCELSVLRLYKIRNFNLKSIKELIEIYPNLKNEVGFICIEQISYHLKNETT
jgi:DNA-directed RNA polymerase alpha subunit